LIDPYFLEDIIGDRFVMTMNGERSNNNIDESNKALNCDMQVWGYIYVPYLGTIFQIRFTK
jgi:hypothetical protein